MEKYLVHDIAIKINKKQFYNINNGSKSHLAIKNLKLFKMKPFVEFLVSKLPTNYSYMNFKFKLERFLRFSGNSEGLANPQWLSPLNSKEGSK